MHETHNHHSSSESTKLEYIKFFGVILAIAVTAVVIFNLSSASGVMDFVRLFMGVFLIVFAVFKFVGYEMFTVMFRGYDLIAKRSELYAKAYPFIELLLGLMFIVNLAPTFRTVGVLFIMGIGSIGVIQEIYFKRSGVHCACLGNIIKLPLSTVSLVENLTMVVMAIYMLVY